jgi:amino acid transporter
MVVTTQPRAELKRQLGLGAATALVIGEVIAVGIFLTPAGMAKSLGSPMWLLVVWLVLGMMALCGALCYGEIADLSFVFSQNKNLDRIYRIFQD